jgi:acetyl-CoA acetyltransferase family protein
VDRYGITRADQDAFALRSHQRAAHAWAQGWFNAEVTPVTVKSGKATTTLSQDEGPRADTSLESLGRLAPAFRDGGSVTAGNSSTLNDGAAAVLLASDTTARERGLRARARWIGAVSAGVDPRVMGIGPVPAVRKLLARHGLVSAQIDAWELNEAFAAQSLAVIRELDLDLDRVNVQGGAIALGHPLGCSGARILTTLLGVLERTGGRFGVATLCVGVGQGLAALIERVEPAQA